ncbi:bestrophin family protein [Alloalcanivorax mobilis]|uniref:bestrophin family protein n=1 Tax=Alloalcanivorax mobilis TaxID=2019569 RepID=UPI0012FFF636|nr:bestrophin family ion channel [Alloalcanivorax mobilis]
MIVRDRPHALALLIALRGSVVPAILPHILAASLFAAGLTLINQFHYLDISHYTVLPVTLLGIVLSILLSFRNNAAYDRWWEARKQWGQMVYEIRALARASGTLLGAENAQRRALLGLLLGFVHALRGQLRDETVEEDLRRVTGDAAVQRALTRSNGADDFLHQAGELLGELYRGGQLDSVGVRVLDERLTALAGIQAACERIASTPLPFAYTLLAHRTAYLYCYLLPVALIGAIGWATPLFVALVAYTFFGLDRLAEELETPFGRNANDLPLDALCRTHEISVAQALGETPPEPLVPVKAWLQ